VGSVASSASAYSYDNVAWCYEGVAALYSAGAIASAKAWQIAHLEPGSRVLYAGVGGGEDALLAVRRGVAVTGLDLSPRMLARFRRRLDREGLEAELILGDVMEHRSLDGYDAVVANFFLNVFDVEQMQRVLAHLVSNLRPGGTFLVADFAVPGSGRIARGMRVAYYRPVNWAARVVGLCALHPIHDYAASFDRVGLALERRQGFRPLGRGPVLYESLVARRIERAV
jgi:cyclopropane fatty-acyl-phospholipid synthase-like methyltransferase